MSESSAPENQSQSLVGQLIEGKYQVLSKIGHGGMGVVYRARHTLMDREVALKVLHPHLIESEEFLKRFRHEAQVASKLRHPNAVMIYDFGMTGNLPYLVMEFVQGDTFKDLIGREGPQSARKLLSVMSQVFSALGEAHRLGIVHRDLKPDNFILTQKEDGTYLARVLDFGIAKMLHPATGGKEATVMTQAGAFFGTPRYASPEQALGKELDARADIYSLGVILYEALSGQVPFDAPSMMELLMKHLNQPPPPLRSGHPGLGISEPVEKVVLKCLEKDRENRFQNIGDLDSAFKVAVETIDLVPRKGGYGPIVFLGGLLAAVFAAIAYLLFSESADEKDDQLAHVQITSTPVVTEIQTQVPTSIPTIEITAFVTPTSLAQQADLELTTPTSIAESTPEPTSITQTPEPTVEITPEPSHSPVPTINPTETPSSTATPEARKTDSDIESLDSISAFKKGEQLYKARNYKGAIPYYQQVIAKDSGFKKARLSLGICYLRLNRMDEAFQQFKAAYDIDRNYAPTLFNFACYYSLTGQTEAALRWLEKTIRQDPSARRWAVGEPDLESIRHEAKFRELTR